MDAHHEPRPSAKLVADYLEHLAPGVHREAQVRAVIAEQKVSRRSVYDWLAGKKRPAPGRLVAFAKALGRLDRLEDYLLA